MVEELHVAYTAPRGGFATWAIVLSSLFMLSICGLLVASGLQAEEAGVVQPLALEIQPYRHSAGVISTFTRADHRYAKLVQQSDALLLGARRGLMAAGSAASGEGGKVLESEGGVGGNWKQVAACEWKLNLRVT